MKLYGKFVRLFYSATPNIYLILLENQHRVPYKRSVLNRSCENFIEIFSGFHYEP